MGNRIGMFISLVSLCSIAIGACVGCASTIRNAGTRSIEQQSVTVVQLSVSCSNYAPGARAWGSGVIISKTQVLTASHVVDCISPADGTSGHVLNMFASQPDNIGRPLKLETMSLTSDIARLRIADDGEWYGVPELRLGPAPAGTEVCIETGVPHRDRHCGTVERSVPVPHGMSFSMPVEPGNSGSPIYDRRGRLVGITTQRRSLANGQSIGGLATATADRPWILSAIVGSR